MTQAVARFLEDAKRLSPAERAELTDHLVEGLGRSIPAEIEESHLAEVRRRIARVEAGEVTLIPGDEALAQVRRLLAEAGGTH